MKRSRLRRALAAVLFVAWISAAVCAPACAEAPSPEETADTRTLAQVVDELREEYRLNETNFSVSYYNTVTGESYAWNDTYMMLAASTYKLPLNLYYYELERAGTLDADSPIGGTTLANAHFRSIVNSENEISHAMIDAIGSFPEYKQAMRKYFDMRDEEIDPVYYADNHYCTRMMMEVLQYLYENADDYPELLEYLLQACPDMYAKRYVTEYAVAHKYGSYAGYENDVAIIYAKQPFLLAVYTYNVGGEEICAQFARELTDYTDRQYQIALEQAEETARAAEAAAQKAAEETERRAAEAAEEQAAAQTAKAEEAASVQELPQEDAKDEPSALTRVAAFLVGGQPLLWMIPLAALIALGGAACIRPLFSGEEGLKKRMEKYTRMADFEQKESPTQQAAAEAEEEKLT